MRDNPAFSLGQAPRWKFLELIRLFAHIHVFQRTDSVPIIEIILNFTEVIRRWLRIWVLNNLLIRKTLFRVELIILSNWARLHNLRALDEDGG